MCLVGLLRGVKMADGPGQHTSNDDVATPQMRISSVSTSTS